MSDRGPERRSSGGSDGGRAVDPRVERSRMVILNAAVEELADVGYGGVTIESIAARAGVGEDYDEVIAEIERGLQPTVVGGGDG